MTPFAKKPVLVIAGVAALLMLIASAVDGYFFDELYFLSAGKHHLDWGYADQPPLVPLLARAMDFLFPGSVVGLRLPATLVMAATVVVAALTARELGGAKRAQVMAAGAAAISLHAVTINHWLATYMLDPLWWSLALLLVTRWVRTREDRLLLGAGVVTALALQTKFLIPVLWVALGLSVLVVGPRELLRRPMLWLGAGLAVLATVPGLVWQAANGWPQAEMTQVVAREAAMQGGRPALLIGGLVSAGVLAGVLLCLYGGWFLLQHKELRFLGWTVVGVVALLLITNGQPRYVAGLYPLLFAAGAVRFERAQPARWWSWSLRWPGYVLSTVVALGVGGFVIAAQAPFAESGPAETAKVAAEFHRLPAEQRERTAVVAAIYPTAATLDRFGPELGLPLTQSPHRGYWYFGAPDEHKDTVLYIGEDVDRVRPYFDSAREVAPQIWLCLGKRFPWKWMWSRIRYA
ncbi:glycosyltransferase family 39 protein [Allokutzneria multivorans]|uniref:Glycosyltransferase family 39 protein n=1 Tax=Allokutzneria multivorans TaxID=1142134 RepID=A0ABP7SUT5_9PSEU